MNRFRLRGTWEEDPAPIPFPVSQAGRQAGAEADERDAPSSDEVIRGVEAEFDRISLKIDELRDMLTPYQGDTDPPPAA